MSNLYKSKARERGKKKLRTSRKKIYVLKKPHRIIELFKSVLKPSKMSSNIDGDREITNYVVVRTEAFSKNFCSSF